MNEFITTYSVLAFSHLGLQIVFAYLTKNKKYIDMGDGYKVNYQPKVSIIVPVYNEKPLELDKCLTGLVQQTYKNIEIFVVDDGSDNIIALNEIYNHKPFKDSNLIILNNPTNMGKREAQKLAITQATGEIIVTVDSDTVLAPNGIEEIIKPLAVNGIGAVTGQVAVLNRTNLLTKLISYRYWNAFNIERAAQSYFGQLMCVSGPFGAYRKSELDKVMYDYTNQMFLGQKATFGDDRHLTNLLLKNGNKIVYQPKAIAHTVVPDTLSQYGKQQLRWNKSFYREAYWTFQNVTKKNKPFLFYDLFMQLLLPILLVGAIANTIVHSLTDVSHLWMYALTITIVALLRVLYALIKTKDVGFLLFLFYGFMHVLFLLPIRVLAIATMTRTGWGTR